MTDRQKKFCDEYLIDCNAARAYRAVYLGTKSDKAVRANASRLLANDNIREYIKNQLDKIHNDKTADTQEVLEYLTGVMRGANEETKDRIKAAELLGRRFAMFTDKITSQTSVSMSQKLSDILAQVRDNDV